MDTREEQVVCCGTCGLAQRVEPLRLHYAAVCSRCGSTIDERRAASLIPTVAFSLAALVFYIPANIYPILTMQRYGLYSETTVWQGVVELVRLNYWFIGLIVFLASIAVPLLKLLALFFLSITAHLRTRRWRRERTWLFRFIEVIGPWSMLDVFLLAILVALVRLGSLATVLPGRGLLAFTCVVVLTLLASQFFDPKLIWRGYEEADEHFTRKPAAPGAASPGDAPAVAGDAPAAAPT
jgi:paraquat-inducible protein A